MNGDARFQRGVGSMAGRPECPACGVWSCGDCGARRQNASRYSDLQDCTSCGSLNGKMLPVRHTSRGKAWEHLDWHDKERRAGVSPSYPLTFRGRTSLQAQLDRARAFIEKYETKT